MRGAGGHAHRHALFDQLGVPQSFCDMHAVLVDVNDAFCALMRRPREQLLGRHVSELNHRTDDGRADAALARLLTGGRETVQVERILSAADGRSVPVLVDAALLRDVDGTPVGAGALFRDLSELRSVELRRQQQEDFFLAMSQRASDLAIVVDVTGRMLYASPALSGVLGYTAEQVVDCDGWDFVHPDDIPATGAIFERVVANGGTETFLVRVRDAAGSWRRMEETVTNLLDTAVGGLVCNLRDISERVEAERALRASETRYRAIADTAEEGLWFASTEGRTLYANGRMADILGVELDELYRLPVTTLLFGDGVEVRAMEQRLKNRAARGPERYELSYQHPDGRRRALWISAAPMQDADGGSEGSLAMVSDITEARRLEQELRHAALHDSLTGLPNKALLVDRLEHAIARETSATAVLLIDLDRFRILNDSRGHTAGDDVLVTVSERLQEAVRPFDTVARFGGDEFVVVCEDIDETVAEALAEEIRAHLSTPFVWDGGVRHTSASIGIAVTPASSAEHLLRNAETAMYSAKAAGRNRVRLFDRELAVHADERYALSTDLRSALAEDTLAMHYQPIVDLQSGHVVGMEALARWDHPSLGRIPPDRFVPVAEETGLAQELDRWALRRAIRETGALRTEGAAPRNGYVAVNLSARNLGDAQIEGLVARCADAAALAPQEVVLEITESAFMEDTDGAIVMLRRLRQRGFQIAIDDFGTGYSSMAYLRDLPITTLKIDRTFVAGIGEDPDALAIVKSIIDLARAIGVTTVAEGVETAQHAALLRTLGCNAAQGWLWSPAVAPADARSTGALHGSYDVAHTGAISGADNGADNWADNWAGHPPTRTVRTAGSTSSRL